MWDNGDSGSTSTVAGHGSAPATARNPIEYDGRLARRNALDVPRPPRHHGSKHTPSLATP